MPTETPAASSARRATWNDRICISTAKEPIARDLSLREREMGWVLSVFALGYAFCQMPSGWLADRLGPRRVLSGLLVPMVGPRSASRSWLEAMVPVSRGRGLPEVYLS